MFCRWQRERAIRSSLKKRAPAVRRRRDGTVRMKLAEAKALSAARNQLAARHIRSQRCRAFHSSDDRNAKGPACKTLSHDAASVRVLNHRWQLLRSGLRYLGLSHGLLRFRKVDVDVRDHQHFEVGHALDPGLCPRSSLEARLNNDHDRVPRLENCNTVAHGGGSAGPSSPDAHEGIIDFFQQSIHLGLRCRSPRIVFVYLCFAGRR